VKIARNAIFDPRKADVAHASNIPGQKVSQGSYSALVPAPLPPDLKWAPRLISTLSDADQLVGRLAGEGDRLPNPHIFIPHFVQREAVLSSKIEGTQATLGELLATEAGAIVDRSPEHLREVGNCVVALEHGISRLENLPLLRQAHPRVSRKAHDGRSGASSRARTFSQDPELDWQAWQHDRNCVLHPTPSRRGPSRCQPRWSRAWETASLAERGNARLHSTRSSKAGDQQEDVVTHISPDVFYVAQGQRGGCQGCTGAVAALNSKDDIGHLHTGPESAEA